MKLYKCNYCGRVFDKQMPHKCNHGFRKHKHSWTEIEDSDNEYQKVENPFTKEKQIYDILYDLYVDDTDCTQCGYYTGFCLLEKQCAHHEHFMADEVVKVFLIKKAKEIHELFVPLQ